MIKNYKEISYYTDTIQGEKVKLRKLTPDDLNAFYHYQREETMHEHQGSKPVKNLEEAKELLYSWIMPEQPLIVFAIEKENKLVGACSIFLRQNHDSAEIGYEVGKEYWGQGIATEVNRLLIDFCFKTLKLNRVTGVHYDGNLASGKVMSKSGMKHEGTRKQDILVKGKFRDVFLYGLIREDYEATV